MCIFIVQQQYDEEARRIVPEAFRGRMRQIIVLAPAAGTTRSSQKAMTKNSGIVAILLTVETHP